MEGFSGPARTPWTPAPILSRDEVLRAFGRPRVDRLVFTNGIFDLLHRGHVVSLQAARARGDRLVIAINSDDSARRLKGRERPFQAAEDRAAILAALRCVDAVTVFDEDTPATLIEALLPDVLAKGADYEEDQIVGARAVREAGGEVVRIPLEGGRSSSTLVRRIRSGDGPHG
jgi:D-beta-D-heptose 7-phosphate kinase/D-beta-D-heptose 1-phosphate adenosyltransferase